jgi:hypothetical protein
MLVGDKVSHAAVSEAYCLLSSYIREEGKIGTNYNVENLQNFIVFLAEVLKHPDNFVEDKNKKGDNNE